MLETIAQDPSVPWGYDWLGMAYIELEDYSIKTYEKAFTLSDGLVEVRGGLGHALGMAGLYEPAKFMTDFYAVAAQEKHLFTSASESVIKHLICWNKHTRRNLGSSYTFKLSPSMIPLGKILDLRLWFSR